MSRFTIERRAKRDLWSYCFVNPRYYESLDRYAPQPVAYDQTIQKYLAPEYSLAKEGIWFHAFIPRAEILRQGFKIHLSATARTADAVFERALPVLIEQRVAFKTVVDSVMLTFVNSKNFSRGSSGKFMTIYPDSTQFVVLLEQLEKALASIEGPYILSDKPYKDSKTVFYRYGGFIPRFRLNIFGEKEPVIDSVEGKEIPDIRTPYFKLPAGVTDPFESSEPAHQGPVVLNKRFQIESTINQSNSGGVYKARDLTTGKLVIVKEARPFIQTSEKLESVESLQREHRVLSAMQDTPHVPRLIDFFQEWQHHFLVEEFVEGMVMSSFRALEDFSLLLNRVVTPESVAQFCRHIKKIAANVNDAIKAFHDRGIILGDLSPNNVFIKPETLDITLIDFEGCHFINEGLEDSKTGMTDSIVTVGFVSPARLSGRAPSTSDDYYSLGSLIYNLIFPAQIFFYLNPAAVGLFIEEIARDFRLPDDLRLGILDLLNEKIESGLEHFQFKNGFKMSEPATAASMPSSAQLQTVISNATDFILKTASPERSERLWPSDYRVFSTNPLNLAYGALGTALFLQRTLATVPEAINVWLLNREINARDYAPGLFVGLAGIAWAFAELGMEDKAHEAMELASRSPLLSTAPDLFYGLAGFGLSILSFWHRTDDEKFLLRACEAGDRLLELAVHEGQRCDWKNVDNTIYSGYAHGASGIALFLLALYGETQDTKYLRIAKAAMETEISRAAERNGGLAWDGVYGHNIVSPYWRYGSAGVGSVLLRFFVYLQEERYKILAEKAARYVACKYTVFPGQMVGLSGIGDFLLDMYEFTGNQEYLAQADTVASGILLYQVPRAEGTAFPGEELVRITTDFATGSAGIVTFLHRRQQAGKQGRLIYDCNSLKNSFQQNRMARAIGASVQ
jgi:serine/threonine protein kinase